MFETLELDSGRFSSVRIGIEFSALAIFAISQRALPRHVCTFGSPEGRADPQPETLLIQVSKACDPQPQDPDPLPVGKSFIKILSPLFEGTINIH